MQYTENILVVKKNENFHYKTVDIFSYFCSKHRLWVHVRTASVRRIRKIGIPLHTPVFLYKSGVHGSILHTDMFS